MKKIPMILLALIFAASCGDNGNDNKPKFNPETDWVEITVSDQLGIDDELSKLAALYLTDGTDDCSTKDFLCVTPKNPSANKGPFFRNVTIKGSITILNHFQMGLNSYFDQIYNLDMSGTMLKEMAYSMLPENARWVALPETLTNMGAAFSGCKHLEEMVIPKNVKTVHDYNFEKLPCLKRVVVNAATPPELLFACEFEGSPVAIYPKIYPSSGWELTVPAGSKAAYEAHEWWGMFSSITEK